MILLSLLVLALVLYAFVAYQIKYFLGDVLYISDSSVVSKAFMRMQVCSWASWSCHYILKYNDKKGDEWFKAK